MDSTHATHVQALAGNVDEQTAGPSSTHVRLQSGANVARLVKRTSLEAPCSCCMKENKIKITFA